MAALYELWVFEVQSLVVGALKPILSGRDRGFDLSHKRNMTFLKAKLFNIF